jgi:hypothetical protein
MCHVEYWWNSEKGLKFLSSVYRIINYQALELAPKSVSDCCTVKWIYLWHFEMWNGDRVTERGSELNVHHFSKLDFWLPTSLSISGRISQGGWYDKVSCQVGVQIAEFKRKIWLWLWWFYSVLNILMQKLICLVTFNWWCLTK